MLEWKEKECSPRNLVDTLNELDKHFGIRIKEIIPISYTTDDNDMNIHSYNIVYTEEN